MKGKMAESDDDSKEMEKLMKEGSGPATKYDEAVLARLMDESRHWQLKAYVTMCTEVLSPRDVEISDVVAWQVDHMQEYTERVWSPAKFDSTQSSWEMVRDGRGEVSPQATCGCL